MLWHRQAIFKSKGDKLCSSAECRLWTRGPRHQIASRLNGRWQTDWAIEDQAKNLNSTARPYDQRAFCSLDPTVSWLSHLALAIYIFVVVNFDALAQVSDIQIERRQVVFLCWMQDLNIHSKTKLNKTMCISWWRHQMETFSASRALCAGNSPVTGEFPAQRLVTRSFDVFFCVWINSWINNREAGDLRRYRAHYDVIAMLRKIRGIICDESLEIYNQYNQPLEV